MFWVIKHSRLQLSYKQCHAGFYCWLLFKSFVNKLVAGAIYDLLHKPIKDISHNFHMVW